MQILAVSMNDILLLLFAGMLAGSMNALAGGGSFVSLPALISVGVPSVAANATSTFSLFPGGLASSWVYRDGFGKVCGVPVLPIALATVLGGLCGSVLLLLTPSSVFDAILPWLLLIATLMLVFGRRISAVFRSRASARTSTIVPVQFFLGVYGGYFGGAVGLMMLAAWSVFGGGEIKELNPMRMLMVMAANAVAVIVFVAAGAIAWSQCLPMLIGALLGGWVGAHIGRKLPASAIRALTIVLAVATTTVFFARAYFA